VSCPPSPKAWPTELRSSSAHAKRPPSEARPHTAGDYVTFFLEAGGPAVIEQIAAHSYMAFRGVAGSSVNAGSGTISISTAFDGYLHNCTVAPGPFLWTACDAAHGHAGCHSKNNRLTFTKR
jgi:hypothetical protein